MRTGYHVKFDNIEIRRRKKSLVEQRNKLVVLMIA
jgi:hypothetical protein